MPSLIATLEGGRKASLSSTRRAPFLLMALAALLVLSGVPAAMAREGSPLSGFNPAVLADMANGPMIGARSFWADNALPLSSIVSDDWEDGPYTPARRNNADVWWQAELGFVYHQWRMAGVHRGELFIETNRDTIEALHHIKVKEKLEPGRVFDVDLEANGFSAYGLEVSKGVKLDGLLAGLRGGMTVRYLYGEMVQDAAIKGTLTPTSAKEYDFDLALSYDYDRNVLYQRKNDPPGRGDGFSIDAGLSYSWKDKLFASLLVRDILGAIYWRDVPYTTAEATSAVKTLDESGFQKFSPTIKGYEGYRNHTQRIPLKTDLDLAYREGAYTISSTINFIEDRPLYWLNLDYQVTPRLTLTAGYNVNYQAVTLGVAYGPAVLKITTDDINLERANAVGFLLNLVHPF